MNFETRPRTGRREERKKKKKEKRDESVEAKGNRSHFFTIDERERERDRSRPLRACPPPQGFKPAASLNFNLTGTTARSFSCPLEEHFNLWGHEDRSQTNESRLHGDR